MSKFIRFLWTASLPAVFAVLTCQSGQAAGISTYAELTAALATGVVTNFAPVASIGFSTSQETLQITRNTIIDGGTNNVIIDGSDSTRLFVVHTNCQLILANLQLRHGLGGNGGAIQSSGVLIVSNCIFLGNTATNASGSAGAAATSTNENGAVGGAGGSIWGGAIYSYGPLYVYNTVFETNAAVAGNGGDGGAGFSTTGTIFATSGGAAGSGGNAYGGAIYSSGSTNVIFASEFLGNMTSAGDGGSGGGAGENATVFYSGGSGQGGAGGSAYGGAVFVTGSLSTSNCLFASNDSLGGNSETAGVAFNGAGFNGSGGGLGLGGGLFVSATAAFVDMENSVYYANICAGGGGANAAASGSTSGSGGAAVGGGVYVGAVATTIRNCTLADNLLFAGTNGVDTGTNGSDGLSGQTAGWDVFRSAGTVKMANSIVAGASASANGVTDSGYNLCSDASLTRLLPTTRVQIDPKLDTGLSHQGPELGPVGIPGYTLQTLAVLAGPATNAIPGVPGITFPATDERLLARGTPSTIGAFEVNTITPTNTAPATISQEPQNQIAVIGQPSVISVNATTNANDPNPLGFQWRLNGVNLTQGGNFTGVNSPTLTIKAVANADLGAYQVIISPSTLDSVTNSAVAYLLVNIPTTIVTQPASKLNVPDGAVENLIVKVSGSPPFSYQWRFNGVPLTDGNEFSGSATTNLTINPTTPVDAGSYTVVITNFYRSVTSAVARVTVATDRTKPSIIISEPTASSRTLTNALYGTTTDNAQVTNVDCWITNIVAGVTNVFFTNAILSTTGTTTKSWGITNALSPGTNIVAVRSVDYSSNSSPIVSRKFFYVVPSVFSLSLNGPGSAVAKVPFAGATPPTNGATLEIGQGYTLVASPDHDCLLTNWTSASFTSYSNTLHFTMTPNLAVRANFIISPFLAIAGGYSGLFFATNGDFSPATAGELSGLTVGPVGTYSAQLLTGAGAFPISGSFDVFGHASNYVARGAAAGGPIGVSLDLDAATEQLTGSVSGRTANWASPLSGEKNVATPGASSFESTLLLSASTNGAGEIPPGFGYLLLTNHSGTVVVSGALPDGTAIAGSAPLGVLGHVPVYASLYGHAGILTGWITLTNPTPTIADGLFWTRPAAKSLFYAAGFSNMVSGQGSPWTNDPNFVAQATLGVSNASATATYPVLINKGVIISSNGAAVKGTVNTKTGLVKVTFPGAVKNTTVAGAGAILQDSGALGGYFITKTNAGIISSP